MMTPNELSDTLNFSFRRSLHRDVFSLTTAMQYLKTQKSQPLSQLWHIKTQRCGLRHTVYSANGDEYTGEWLDNKKHGKGTQVWKKDGAVYDGDWKLGKRDGYGTYSILLPKTNEYSRLYCGRWKNGMKHGYGTYFYSSSAVYEGEWSEDKRNGWGRMYYDKGDIYEGEWMKDKSHGQGIIRLANENWYEGGWKDGKKHGNGKFYYLDKGQLYEGLWVDGVAKCGTLSDHGRDEAPIPTKYPIPKVHLLDMQAVLKETQSTYQ
ncbi:MORN repeat-containing protein 3 isoform X1 [Myripristis murdjan]|uniref:MORN repeat-containing protein 3 n=2 Tax=Myripristis murdjan TaxID=586833 RepID=A0A668ABM8_9TELE|nr:MORN repeat-containing protein 3 isoform X1 [Myripristis murdjan]